MSLRTLVFVTLASGCYERPYVTILEPAPDVVVEPDSTVSVLAYAWDATTGPDDLRVEAWFGSDPVPLVDAGPADDTSAADDTGEADDTSAADDTDAEEATAVLSDRRLRVVKASVVVNRTDELRFFVTDKDGRLDDAEALICIAAADCGQPTTAASTEDTDDTDDTDADDTGTTPVDDTGTTPVDDTGTTPVDDTGTTPKK